MMNHGSAGAGNGVIPSWPGSSGRLPVADRRAQPAPASLVMTGRIARMGGIRAGDAPRNGPGPDVVPPPDAPVDTPLAARLAPRQRTEPEETMQIGFNLPISGPMATPETIANIAQLGEALGFDYLTLT